MNKFQKINFRSVSDFLDYLPEQELRITESLREVIIDTIPQAREKLSYNVPYYAVHSNICFIWPSSIPWGSVDEGVSLGFVKGHLLSLGSEHLESKARKTIRSINFKTIQEVNFDLIRALIHEAVVVDQETRKRKGN